MSAYWVKSDKNLFIFSNVLISGFKVYDCAKNLIQILKLATNQKELYFDTQSWYR